MSAPYYKLYRGRFAIVGKEPDGDSIRFIADEPDYSELWGSHRIKKSADDSVQLRLEAIDAPELHYGLARQPLGVESRDLLLNLMGFRGVSFEPGGRPTRVLSAEVPEVRGAIFTKGVDPNGRPVSYVATDVPAAFLDHDWIRLDGALLAGTMNAQMLDSGLAYYTVYTSTPLAHRQALSEIAMRAKTENRGVWALDSTPEWVLENMDSVGAGGQLILPKLFRRCVDYLRDVARGFSGELSDWLLSKDHGARNENDRVVVYGTIEVPLSALITQRNKRVAFSVDPLDITFVEK
jgi:endonuclease YncB( thermonuclease family)